MRHTDHKVARDDRNLREQYEKARIAGLGGRDIVVHEIGETTHRLRIIVYGRGPTYGPEVLLSQPAFFPSLTNPYLVAVCDVNGENGKVLSILSERAHQTVRIS